MAVLDVLTLPEAKTVLGVAGTTEHDDQLPGWVTTVSQRLDKLVGPVVQRTVTEEKHDGGGHIVFLKRYPVLSVTSVTEYTGTTATVLSEETTGSQPSEAYLTEPYSVPVTLADGTPLELLSNRLLRRSGDSDSHYPTGRRNVVVDYVAGRFADTASVEERYKKGAAIMLLNLWRSQQHGTGSLGEYDVPQGIFPGFAVPKAVTELFPGETHDPRFLVA